MNCLVWPTGSDNDEQPRTQNGIKSVIIIIIFFLKNFILFYLLC